MYIRTSSFVSLETTFYIACNTTRVCDPKMQQSPDIFSQIKIPLRKVNFALVKKGARGGIETDFSEPVRITKTCLPL